MKILIREISLLFQSPQLFIIRWFKCFLLNSLLGKKRDFYYLYNGKTKVKFPNSLGVSYVLMETFVYKIFSRMKGLNRVLDIGGFIGESAIYLADHNKEVYCYELSQKNFAYLQSNCSTKHTIHFYNAGITVSQDEYIEYREDTDVDSTIKVVVSSSQNRIKVKNINIGALLKEHAFDGLKLDIEGGEYEILSAIIDAGQFDFKKGIIEFHDLNRKKNLDYLLGFMEYLNEKNYMYELLTNEAQKVSLLDLHSLRFCNIYFALSELD